MQYCELYFIFLNPKFLPYDIKHYVPLKIINVISVRRLFFHNNIIYSLFLID